MLNLYAVMVWHSSGPRHYETIEVRTYTPSRAQHLARESFPGCRAIAEPIYDLIELSLPMPYLLPTARPQ